jgi:hypothetical protein
MQLRWKIFRITNIVQMLLIIALLTLVIANGKLSLKNTEDVIGLIIFSVTSIIIAGNSINNILLLSLLKGDNNTPFPRRIFFWGTAILNCLLSFFLIIVIIVSYPSMKKMNDLNRNSDFIWMTILLSWLLLIGVNGIYIFSQQVVLFISIRKASREKNIELVTNIGEQPE